MKNLKFTGTNIASAVLVIAFFLPWADVTFTDFSGFKLLTTAISPGFLKSQIKGIDRLLMLLIVIVPVSGAFLIWQNIAPQPQYKKYIKQAHFAPLAVIAGLIAYTYFKAQHEISKAQEALSGLGNFGGMANKMLDNNMPGVFDVLDIGAYISIAASAYLLLVGIGKIKDKEYFNNTAAATPETPANTTEG